MKFWLKIVAILWGMTFTSPSSPGNPEDFPKLDSENLAQKITQTCDASSPSLG